MLHGHGDPDEPPAPSAGHSSPSTQHRFAVVFRGLKRPAPFGQPPPDYGLFRGRRKAIVAQMQGFLPIQKHQCMICLNNLETTPYSLSHTMLQEMEDFNPIAKEITSDRIVGSELSKNNLYNLIKLERIESKFGDAIIASILVVIGQTA